LIEGYLIDMGVAGCY